MSVFETKITRSYQQEDIQQILNLAIARQDNVEEFSHEQLVEIANELGISTATLLEAERDWLLQKGEQQKRNDFNLYRQSKLKRRFGKYLIINSFLVGLNFLSNGQISWSLYILLFWSLSLGLNTWNTYQLQGEEYEQAFQKWYRKYQLTKSISTRINNWMKVLN
jgi:hypothetical protein